jgi:hypothetical protein
MDFVYSQSPWVLPKDPEGTEKIFSDHGWKVTFNLSSLLNVSSTGTPFFSNPLIF